MAASYLPQYSYSSSSKASGYGSSHPAPLDVALPAAPQSRTVKLANGVEMYFREAGNPNNPPVLLLHGFPTSSNYFRHLIVLLSSPAYNFYVLAPDLPGFGATVCPESYVYTFQKLAETVVLFIDAIDVSSFSLYCMGEYGTLTALKVIQFKMENILGLIIQNGTIYNESRLDLTLFDVYKTGSYAPSNSNHKYGHRSFASSLRSSRRNSDTSLFSDTSEDQDNRPSVSYLGTRSNNSRVSFSISVDEYSADGLNAVSKRDTYRSQGDKTDDESDSEIKESVTSPSVLRNAPTLLSPSVHLQSPSTPCIVKPVSTPTIEQVKNLYFPVKPSKVSLSALFNRSSTTRTIDPHACLFDYYLLIRPGQDQIQSQLYIDYLAENRRGTPLSSPISMWFRTTNTPVLILWGTNDPFLSQKITIENFKRDCRHCEVKILENGGHFALEYYPDEIAETIFEFLSNNKMDKGWSVTAY